MRCGGGWRGEWGDGERGREGWEGKLGVGAGGRALVVAAVVGGGVCVCEWGVRARGAEEVVRRTRSRVMSHLTPPAFLRRGRPPT